jgi:hypothetical protein
MIVVSPQVKPARTSLVTPTILPTNRHFPFWSSRIDFGMEYRSFAFLHLEMARPMRHAWETLRTTPNRVHCFAVRGACITAALLPISVQAARNMLSTAPGLEAEPNTCMTRLISKFLCISVQKMHQLVSDAVRNCARPESAFDPVYAWQCLVHPRICPIQSLVTSSPYTNTARRTVPSNHLSSFKNESLLP